MKEKKTISTAFRAGVMEETHFTNRKGFTRWRTGKLRAPPQRDQPVGGSAQLAVLGAGLRAEAGERPGRRQEGNKAGEVSRDQADRSHEHLAGLDSPPQSMGRF